MAANENLRVAQFDVKTAFLYSFLEEDIFMKQPDGFDDGSGRACRLLKRLYGLKQAPRCWNKKITEFLKSYDLKESEADPCLFINKDQMLFVVLFVDDGLVVARVEDYAETFLHRLQEAFKVTIESANCFLGMEIHKVKDGIFINQQF